MSRKMKDSGVEWIGEIPEDWEVAKLKNFVSVSSGEYIPKEHYHYNGEFAVVGSNGIIGKTKYKNNDDEVITTGRVGTIGTVNIVKEAWITDNTLIIKPEGRISIRYLYYVLPNFDYGMISSGTAQPLITATNLKNQYFSFPSNLNQQKIANFLDKKVAEIDHIITKTQASIEEYKRYKQSIITEAVTKGLDPNVPMKDSGIEWIGEIPEKWCVVRLKYTSLLKGRIGWQGLRSNEYVDQGPYLITGTDFNKGVIKWDTCAHILQERYWEAPDIHIRENDLLITKDGTIGKVAIAKNCPREVSLNSGVMLIRNTKEIKYHSKFLYYVLLSDEFWQWYRSNITGNSTILHLYQEQFYNFSYALPSHKKQDEIVQFLDEKVERLDQIIGEKELLINNLESYKKSLIYEVVTGKKEVI